MGASKPSTKCPVKTAKKILKKHDQPSIKLKALTKSVMDKIGNDDLEKDDLRRLLVDSGKFVVDGKLVSLNDTKKKRSGSDDDDDDEQR